MSQWVYYLLTAIDFLSVGALIIIVFAALLVGAMFRRDREGMRDALAGIGVGVAIGIGLALFRAVTGVAVIGLFG